MIYLASSNRELFEHSEYKIISVKESLDIMKDWNVIQFDTETSGKDPHLCTLLCAQFGNRAADTQIVVDCSCIDIRSYKELLESAGKTVTEFGREIIVPENIGALNKSILDSGILLHQMKYERLISSRLSLANRRNKASLCSP